MGNKTSMRSNNQQKTSGYVLLMYQQLISRDFNDKISMIAAKKYPNNLEKAVNFILNSQSKLICKGDEECVPLNRLIKMLKYYKAQTVDDNEKIDAYFNENKKFIINDYHHILDCHLNEDKISTLESNNNFECIYNILINDKNNLNCDISKCIIYERNTRDRNINDDNKDINVAMDILDSIHSYFIHSVDTGVRYFISNHEDDEKKTERIDNYFDSEICMLRERLSKRNGIIGLNRIKQKFMTQTTINKQKIENKDEDEENAEDNETDNDYNFGLRFNYYKGKKSWWGDYKKLSAKYANLKEELLKNKINKIGIVAFNNTLQKAQTFKNQSKFVKNIKCTYDDYSYYGIKHRSLLSLHHVLSVILYCDLDNLSFNFSSTFRKIESDKSNDDILTRNKEFGNWTKHLIEVVNCFGEKMNETKINVLYHGISFMYLNKFVPCFNGPTSTTTKLSVSYRFAQQHNGIILELTKANGWPGNDLRYFNCSPFSSFANEDERLFITPAYSKCLQIIGIRNIARDQKYDKFIQALTTLQRIIRDGDFMLLEDKLIEMEIIHSINDLFSNYLNPNNDHAIPNYVATSFKKYTQTITTITMFMHKVNKCILWSSPLIFITDDKQIKYKMINEVFKNVTKIKIYYYEQFGINFASLLSEIKEMPQSKLTW
eukprot:32455_1